MASAETMKRSQATNWVESLFPLHLRLGATGEEIPARFDEFARNNPSFRIEQTAEGELVMMLPTGGKSGIRTTEICRQVANWSKEAGGYVFDSSTLFRLPSGAKRGPDCAWIRKDRWDVLPEEDQESYPPLAPDLVIELRSKTDGLSSLQSKMEEYLTNGVLMGWLIDPLDCKVYVYRPDQSVVELLNPLVLHSEDIAPGLKLDLASIFC